MTNEEAKAFLKSKEGRVLLSSAEDRSRALRAIKLLAGASLAAPNLNEEEEENE